MKNLINFFFSFDKLMKEKLILPVFWLAVIVTGLWFFETALDAIALGVLANVVNFFEFFVRIILALVSIRLISELAVAVFRINDNLSPDGGKSETANIDPMEEARKVAELAAERARDAAKSAGEKTQAATKSARDSIGGKPRNASDKPKDTEPVKAAQAVPSRKTAPQNPVAKSKRESAAQIKSKRAAAKKTQPKNARMPTKPSAKPAVNKPVQAKLKTAQATTGPKKRGPKPGVKMRRDAQGRLLKKDGTLRAKPGPKAQ